MRAPRESERPGPGEELNTGPAGRAAAGGERDPAARRRARRSSCCSSSARRRRASWAACGCSPGGAVDAEEGDGDEAHRLAAIRELHEEASIELDDPGALVKFSRWITPGGGEDPLRHPLLPRHAARRAGAARSTARSASTSAGSRPQARSRRVRARSEIQLVFPTIKHLEQLRDFASVDELLDYARGREVLPVEPRVVMEGEVARIVLPGEPGY